MNGAAALLSEEIIRNLLSATAFVRGPTVNCSYQRQGAPIRNDYGLFSKYVRIHIKHSARKLWLQATTNKRLVETLIKNHALHSIRALMHCFVWLSPTTPGKRFSSKQFPILLFPNSQRICLYTYTCWQRQPCCTKSFTAPPTLTFKVGDPPRLIHYQR